MTTGDNRCLCSNGSCSYPCPHLTANSHCPFTACINQNAKKKTRCTTYEEILREFKNKYSGAEIDDYRPFNSNWVSGRSGVVAWLKNGDMVAYFPKSIFTEE